MEQVENELDPELLSLHALNFAVDKDSASRSVMFYSHFSQALVLLMATERRIQTGIERELAKYTFSISMPETGIVIKVIDRYPKRLDMDAIPFNPEKLVIYEDSRTKELGCFSIPYFASYHQSFGFRYEHKAVMNDMLHKEFEKGTIFADSPSVRENRGYAYGLELQVAHMSHPAVSEDGVLMSRSAVKKMRFNVFEKRTIECGNGAFPLNIYGNRDRYQPFPEIGQMIRDDGIIMIMRPYNADLMPVEISVFDCMEPDFTFDKPVFVRGPGGRVVDIKVYHDHDDGSMMPQGIMTNVDKYGRALQRFYTEIINTEKQIISERKKKYGETTLGLKPELHQLLVEGRAITSEQVGKSGSNQKLNKMYRKAPVDDYRIEITIEYELTPTIGFKVSDTHG